MVVGSSQTFLVRAVQDRELVYDMIGRRKWSRPVTTCNMRHATCHACHIVYIFNATSPRNTKFDTQLSSLSIGIFWLYNKSAHPTNRPRDGITHQEQLGTWPAEQQTISRQPTRSGYSVSGCQALEISLKSACG